MSTARGPVLLDRVTITSSSPGVTEADGVPVPAHVYHTTTGVSATGGALYSTESLRVIVATIPEHMSPTSHVVWWHGERYSLEGPPMRRMRRGRPHHYTIPLQRTT